MDFYCSYAESESEGQAGLVSWGGSGNSGRQGCTRRAAGPARRGRTPWGGWTSSPVPGGVGSNPTAPLGHPQRAEAGDPTAGRYGGEVLRADGRCRPTPPNPSPPLHNRPRTTVNQVGAVHHSLQVSRRPSFLQSRLLAETSRALKHQVNQSIFFWTPKLNIAFWLMRQWILAY